MSSLITCLYDMTGIPSEIYHVACLPSELTDYFFSVTLYNHGHAILSDSHLIPVHQIGTHEMRLLNLSHTTLNR
jgi:hypothetical protein